MSAVTTFRSFLNPPINQEQCDLCSANLSESKHPHLVEPRERKLLCACAACAMVFDQSGTQRFRRVSDRVRWLRELEIDDSIWEALDIPIGLVFFVVWSASDRVHAYYPGAAGAVESLLPLTEWQVKIGSHPKMRDFSSDTEALLVNKLRNSKDVFRVPIDSAFHLVGLVRKNWQGLSGGSELEKQIKIYFDALRKQVSGS